MYFTDKGGNQMNETIQNIIKRRSVKKYKSQKVPENLIAEIVKCGTYAPSGMNKQAAIILEVTDPIIRNQLSKLNARIMGTSIDPFYNAPVVLIVLANKDIPTYIYDGSLVMENMMLAASSLGLGSCWIHRAKEMFETEEGKELLPSLGITGNYEGIGNCIIGYPEGEISEAKKRKENYVYKIRGAQK